MSEQEMTMALYQIKKFLHSKRNNQQGEISLLNGRKSLLDIHLTRDQCLEYVYENIK
jgi:hypothetical protein